MLAKIIKFSGTMGGSVQIYRYVNNLQIRSIILSMVKTFFVSQNIIRLKCIDSTNNYAAQLLRHSDIFEGTAVVAEFQEKGKGQRGNRWESEKGQNLTFSIILKPAFIKPEQQFLLNKIISLAICDYLKSLEIKHVYIKWPNDILVNGKKIAGILIENIIRSGEIIHSIIGIGFNVNQTKFHSAENPTSLKILTGENFSLDNCFEKISLFVEARYLKLKSSLLAADEDYLNQLFQLNDWKNYSIKRMNYIAKITGVSNHGFLILEKENGEIENCNVKEIIFL